MSTPRKSFAFAMLLLKRLGGLIAVMSCVSFLTFLLYHLAPGDKAQSIAMARYMGEGDVPMDVVNAIREEFHLDQPMLLQFLAWIGDLLTGDLGESLVSGEPVWEIFLPNLKETVGLAATSLLIGLALAFCLSVVSVWRPGSDIDRLAIGFASIGAAIPSYWLGLMLILVFASTLNWLPSYGTGSLAHLVLPATTLGLWVTTTQTRLLRSFLLEAKSAPYLEALRLRGVSELELFWRHILRHALIPAITMIGLEIAALLEGTVMVEVIFSRNGIGSLFVHAVMSRDYPILMFLVLFTAFSYVLVNTILEVFQQWLQPGDPMHSPVKS